MRGGPVTAFMRMSHSDETRHQETSRCSGETWGSLRRPGQAWAVSGSFEGLREGGSQDEISSCPTGLRAGRSLRGEPRSLRTASGNRRPEAAGSPEDRGYREAPATTSNILGARERMGAKGRCGERLPADRPREGAGGDGARTGCPHPEAGAAGGLVTRGQRRGPCRWPRRRMTQGREQRSGKLRGVVEAGNPSSLSPTPPRAGGGQRSGGGT